MTGRGNARLAVVSTRFQILVWLSAAVLLQIQPHISANAALKLG